MKKTLRIVIAIFVILLWMMRLWSEVSPEPVPMEEFVYTNEEIACDEFIKEDTLRESERDRIIQRSWMAYQYDDSYCAGYKAELRENNESRNFRNGLQIPWQNDYVRFWKSLYFNLSRHDADKLSELQDSLLRIETERNLSNEDFASLVVSFVQDIPYEFVLEEPCLGNESKPCNGNVLYGIYSPAEFIYLLKGDCDTRTVLLYTILENLGFDAVIFVSREYEHSMLGIDLPNSGDYVSYKGRNYYFWETTNIGWMPGVIPPDMSNTMYWKVALD